jgi:tetratricopeptide (TPR) repeat protein
MKPRVAGLWYWFTGRRYRLVLLVLAVLLLVKTGEAAGSYAWIWFQYRAARDDLNRFAAADARVRLRRCLAAWPDNPSVHRLASRAARMSGSFAEAENHLRICQHLENTSSSATTLESALLRATLGDLGPVEEYLESRREADPAQAPAICAALVEGYGRMYRVRDAFSCLDGWLRRQPDHPQALFLRAELGRKVKSLARAADDYRRVLDIDPARHDARRQLTVCLLELGQLDEARQHLELVLQHWPGDPEVAVLQARCLGKQGKFKEARETLDAVLAAHPDYDLALRARGQLALLEDDSAGAETWLERALAQRLHDYEAHWALYQALQRQGKIAAAQRQLAEAEELKSRLERLREIGERRMSEHPHDPALHCELGQLLLSLGYTDVGKQWLLSALHEDPAHAAAHAALADYYSRQGDAAKAAQHQSRVRAPKPNI